ncbi:MAG: FHA domain-containing protein [Planctomycetota bacterium]
MSLQLYIKSPLPKRSSQEQCFGLPDFFSKPADPAKPSESLKFWIGRTNDCALKIIDKIISQQHCYIEKTPEGDFKLVDNNSRNGTFVNEIRISETILEEGDAIRLGVYGIAVQRLGAVAAKEEAPKQAPTPETETAPAFQEKSPDLAAPKRLHRNAKLYQPKKSGNLSIILGSAGVVMLVAVIFIFQSGTNPIIPSTDSGNTRKKVVKHTSVPEDPEPISNTLPAQKEAAIEKPVAPPMQKETPPLSKTNAAEMVRDPTRKSIDQELAAQKEQRALDEAKRQDLLKKIQERTIWPELKIQIAQQTLKYQYSKAMANLEAFLKTSQIEEIKAEADGCLIDLKGEYSLFSNMVKSLKDGTSQQKISLDDKVVYITKIDESGFAGSIVGVSGSVYSRFWADTPVQMVLRLFPKTMSQSDQLYLAIFCYHHNSSGEGDKILIRYLKSYPNEKPLVDKILTRYKNIPLPPGGFAEYQGQLVSAEDKSYLEKGCIKYQGKWLSNDEVMAAKGMVKFQNKWVTPAEKERTEKRLSKLAAMKNLLAPKGVINQPGCDKEQLSWENARSKETDHYIVTANLSQEAVDDICYIMECLYFEHKKTFKLVGDAPSKLPVWVFKNAKEYRDHGGMGAGQFGSGPKGKQLMTSYVVGAETNTTMILLHEGTHQFVDLVCNLRPPIWINEGLATYYESSKFEGISLKTNLVNHQRLGMIQDLISKKDVPRLEDIINIRQANFTIYEYAHTWSLVYFFMNYNNGQYADELETYFESIKKKGFENRPKHKELFEAAFKIKFEILEQQWEDFIKKL